MHVCASSCLTVLKLCRSGSIVTHIALYSFWAIMSKETLEAGLGLLRMNSTPSQGSIDDQIKAPPLYAGKLQGIMWTHEWGQDGPHQKATSCCGTSSSGGHLPSIPGFYCTFNRCRSRWCECRLNLMQCMPHMIYKIYIYIYFNTSCNIFMVFWQARHMLLLAPESMPRASLLCQLWYPQHIYLHMHACWYDGLCYHVKVHGCCSSFGKSSCITPFSSWHKIHSCLFCVHASVMHRIPKKHCHTWSHMQMIFQTHAWWLIWKKHALFFLGGVTIWKVESMHIILTHSCMHMQFWWGPTDVRFSQYFFTPWHACALHGLQLSWMIS